MQLLMSSEWFYSFLHGVKFMGVFFNMWLPHCSGWLLL